MKIDNLGLRTKLLIPVMIMTLAVFGIVGFGAFNLFSLSLSANDIIAHKDKAAVYVARTTRTMMMAPYSVFGSLVYDGSSPEGRTAQSDFFSDIDRVDSQLGTAAKLAPDYAKAFDDLKARFHEMAESAKKPLAIGEDSPGLATGKDLTPAQLDKMAEGAREVAAVDEGARKVANGLNSIDDTMINENAKSARDLADRSQFALIAIAVAGLLSVIVASLLTVWISTIKIARPLVALATRMQALADGDLEVDIHGAERRDEIGVMARAVQVFKDSAIARARLEMTTIDERKAADVERERIAADRAAAAAAQSETVHRLGAALNTLAGGDLTVRLEAGFPPEYARIKDDFNAAVAKLRETVAAVISATQSISANTSEISLTSDDLSRRTEQQAANLEETSATLKEITATVRKSADNAANASKVVAATDAETKKSAATVSRAVGAMGEISKSASQINQIIGVIDEIAFQTNLLALNAGVEAARAGDAGRGFAVVASEVRALALRAAQAAKEIKALISKSNSQVTAGVGLIADAGQSLERIVADVSRINELVGEIASGAKEQAVGLDAVSAGVNQMDQATQQNVAKVEQATAAARSLADETSHLTSVVARFQIGGDETEDDLRRELEVVAPHAFPATRRGPGPSNRASGEAQPARPARAKPALARVANGPPLEADDWRDF